MAKDNICDDCGYEIDDVNGTCPCSHCPACGDPYVYDDCGSGH